MTGSTARRRCPACKRPLAGCACALLPRARPATRVIVIQHAAERKVHGNTGALVARVLEGSALLVHGDRRAPLDLSALADPSLDPCVLFPSTLAPVVSPDSMPARPGRTRALVVLDATWSQARKMAQRLPGLARLPFVRLPEGAAPAFRLRTPPRTGQVGTAEAVARALDLLGEAEAAGALRRALAIVAERVLRERGKIPRPR